MGFPNFCVGPITLVNIYTKFSNIFLSDTLIFPSKYLIFDVKPILQNMISWNISSGMYRLSNTDRKFINAKMSKFIFIFKFCCLLKFWHFRQFFQFLLCAKEFLNKNYVRIDFTVCHLILQFGNTLKYQIRVRREKCL